MAAFSSQMGPSMSCSAADTIFGQVAAAEHLSQLMRPLGNVLLLGKQQPVAVYELLQTPSEDAARGPPPPQSA